MCESILEKHKHITESVVCLCFVSASIIIDRTCQRYLHNLHLSFYTDLRERLDRGLIDFGVFVEPADITKYEFLRLPATDRWGVVMRKDSPLSKKSVICPEDLWELPLIISRQTTYDKTVQKWLKRDMSQLNIVATYNLFYNAGLMVDEGIGYVIGIDRLANTTAHSNLRFVPLDLDFKIHFDLVWKKYQVFSNAADLFLHKMQEKYK